MSPPMNIKRVRGWNLILSLLLLLFIQSHGLTQSSLPLDDTSLFREGEILLSKGETERALWRFKTLTTDFPKSPLFNEAKFRMGICYTQLKRPKDAIRILNELLATFLPPPRMVQVFTLLGDNYFEWKDHLNALHWYGKGIIALEQSPGPSPGKSPGESPRESPKGPNDELKKKVRSVIDAYSSEEELKSIESLYRGAYAGGYAKAPR